VQAGSESQVRVAIVGAGYVSKHHIAALRTLEFVDIVGIADLDRDAARAVADQFRIPYFCTDIADLAAKNPTAVYVLTPPATHCKLALQALEMGCHVFVEKPLAETVAQCDAMLELAREKGLLLSVNHSDRLDPVVLKALDTVRRGVCGDLVAVDFYRGSEYASYAGGPRSGVFAKGSYPFQDIGVHGLYLLEAFLGPVENLSVRWRSVARDPNFLFDDWHVQARCERGLGRLHLSWVSRPMQNRLLIQGTQGSIDVDRFLQTVTVNRSLPGPKFVGMVVNALAGSVRRVFAVSWSVLRFALRRLPPSPGIYAGAIDFANAVAKGIEAAVPAEEGRRMVALMEPICNDADTEAMRIFADRLAPLDSADVLVTGAGGFLGGALLRRLVDQGLVVRVLLRRPLGWIEELPRIQVVIGDLGDPACVDHAVAGVSTVYHVGAAMRGGAESFRAGTTVAVSNVIESCLRHRTGRVVYVSSLGVVQHEGRDPGLKITEDVPYEQHPDRRGFYTQSKLDAERAILNAIESRDLPAVVIRPGQIFGPGAEHVAPNGVIGIGGRWILVGNGSATLPLVFVDDVVDALILAGTRNDVTGKVFNIVDNAVISQQDYLAACAREPRGAPKLIRMPRWLMLCIAWGVEVLGGLLRRNVPLSV